MRKIYSPFRLQESACTWYRAEQPIRALEELGLAVATIDDLDSRPTTRRLLLQKNASIIWLHQGFGINIKAWISALEGRQPSDSQATKRPLFLYDVDDDLFNVMESNVQAWSMLGIPSGVRALQTDALHVAASPLNRQSVDLSRRMSILEMHRQNLRCADVVLCSTSEVAHSVRQHVPNARTYVHPNCIDRRQFCRINHAETGRIQILWQGGQGHYECLKQSIKPLKRIHDDYPQVDLIIWGAHFRDLWSGFERIEFVEPVEFSKFYLRLNSFGHDIALAPNYPHAFNASRSAIKFYESALCSKPAACIASRIGSFSREIEHGVTGMLYRSDDELYSAISRLIEVPLLRQSIAESGNVWCLKERCPTTHAGRLHEYLVEIEEETKSCPEP